MNEQRRNTAPLRRRILVLVIILLLMLGALAGRLTQVQLLDSAEASTGPARALAPNTTTLSTPAVRGQILDRSGVPLVTNTAHPSLVLDRAVLASLEPEAEEDLFAALSRALDLPEDELRARTTSCGAPGAAPAPTCTPGDPAAPARLADSLEPKQALAVAERPELYPGVRIEPVPTRAYPAPDGVLAPHALGYLARATADDVEAGDDITDGDLVGRAGLERQYDAILRGTPGRTVVATDGRGVPTEVVQNTPPVPGRNLRTTLDVRVQAVAERALAAQVAERREAGALADSAAAVVVDIRDGGVLALASLPTYDPSVWVGDIDPRTYASLTSPDSDQPLISRVTEAGMAPASTFKPISAIATLKAGGALDDTYRCGSSYRIGGREFRNFEGADHGSVSLQKALEVSCSTIFYESAYQSWLSLGGTKATDDSLDPFLATARDFGLGARTGVDLPGEASGRIPGREWRRSTWEANREQTCARAESGYPEVKDKKRRKLLEAVARENCTDGYLYRGGDAANVSIGQGDVLATPLQMAQVYAAIASGGSTMTPRLAGAFIDPVTGAVEEVEPVPGPRVPIDAEVSAYLRGALESVVTDGTASFGFDGFDLDAWPVAGKTGSAERGAGNDVSWFVSYAPATAPRYAVAVAITQAGLSGEAAVPVARSIHEVLRTVDADPAD